MAHTLAELPCNQSSYNHVEGYTWNDKFNNLLRCNCCRYHQINKPTQLWSNCPLAPFPDQRLVRTCACNCRHLARFMCRDFQMYTNVISSPPLPTRQNAVDAEPLVSGENSTVTESMTARLNSVDEEPFNIARHVYINTGNKDKIIKNKKIRNEISDKLFEVREQLKDCEYKFMMDKLCELCFE